MNNFMQKTDVKRPFFIFLKAKSRSAHLAIEIVVNFCYNIYIVTARFGDRHTVFYFKNQNKDCTSSPSEE
ncbi:MAG: hypothetical protein ACD_63C00058G0003 [uncultured bacterium]|nr:MAG: hypothetical protein ACD_63C00058G0003 [uncultured bacterium]